MTNSQIISYLEDIVAPTQTLNLTWWQIKLRTLAEKLKEEQLATNTKHSEGRDMTKISEDRLGEAFGILEAWSERIPALKAYYARGTEGIDAVGLVIAFDAGLAAMFDAVSDRLGARRASPPPSGEAGEVRVKPLEWVQFSDREGDMKASSGFDVPYVIRPSLSGDYRLWSPGMDYNFPKRCSDLVEAKAAAQADYETRIRTALLPTIKEPTDGK